MSEPHIAVLDFGGQLADVIRNRFEDLGFSVRLFPYDTSASQLTGAAGIVLSGGAKGVYEADAPKCAPEVLNLPVPKLGICYGFCIGAEKYGAGFHRRTREYGETRMVIVQDDPLLSDVDIETTVWMNHGDSIDANGCYDILAKTERGVPSIIRYDNFWGVQFHPEATHTEPGPQIFRNFGQLCGLTPAHKESEVFNAGKFIDETLYRLRTEVGDRTVVVLASGGVDSTTTAKLCQIAGVNFALVYIELGIGRKNESKNAQATLAQLTGKYLPVYDNSDELFSALKEVHDPEAKRKTISRIYAERGLAIMRAYGIEDGRAILAQGTIATDKRESGQEAGRSGKDRGTTAVIKSHHNIEAEKLWKDLPRIDPLERLTKDRVRIVGKAIGLSSEQYNLKPFPGPGLGVRNVTGWYEIEPELASHVAEISDKHGFNGVVLPRKGVGLKGDGRAFEHAALMSGERNWPAARNAAREMINNLDICRVLFCPYEAGLSQEDWSSARNDDFDRESVDVLREATEVVERTLDDYEVKPAQVPVVMFSGPEGRPIFVIRDVDSKDFRTCRPLRKPEEFPWQAYDAIMTRAQDNPSIPPSIFTFDLSDKPGGTTEWE